MSTMNARTSTRSISLALLRLAPLGVLLVAGCGGGSEPSPGGSSGGSAGQGSGRVVKESEPTPGTMPTVEAPPIELIPPRMDFGFIGPNEIAKGQIKLKNTSDKPLTILAVQPSCKCTSTSDLVGKTIPPDGSVELDAELTAQAEPGTKSATIKVLIDGYARVVQVDMKAEVTLPIRTVPPYINLVGGKSRTGRFVVESTDKKPFVICSIHGMPPDYANFDPATDEPRNSYLINYDMTVFEPADPPLYLVIDTDHPESPVTGIRVRHENTFPRPSLKMKSFRGNTGRIEQGGHGMMKLGIRELGTRVNTVISASSQAQAELVSQEVNEEGETWITIKVTPRSDHLGVLYFPIMIYAGNTQQELNVMGTVVPAGSVGCPPSQSLQ